jgi:NTE family protein
MDNLPTDVAKNELHADVIIAVHLKTSAFAESDVNSVLGIFSRAFSAGTARTERAGKRLADVLVEAETERFSTMDYQKAGELIQTGYQAAQQHSSELMQYHLNDADWDTYLATRNSRTLPSPGILRQVKVEGGTGEAQAAATRGVESLDGMPIDTKENQQSALESGRKR